MRLKINDLLQYLMVIAAFVVFTSISSFGQMPGNVEVTGHGGVVGGLGGSHGSLGGSIGAPITDRLILSGDLSYIPMGGGTVSFGGSTVSTSAKAINFNGNVMYQFNPKHDVVPHAGAGLGLLRSSFSSTSTGIPGNLNVSGSSTDLYFNFGGGFRYYVKDRWGIKPEFMVFAGPNTFVRFAGGIFYQFGE